MRRTDLAWLAAVALAALLAAAAPSRAQTVSDGFDPGTDG